MAVAVEVAGRDSDRADGSGVVALPFERAIAVVQEYRDGLAVDVGGRNVRPVVAVQVGERDRDRRGGGRVVHVRRERSMAVVDQHADHAAAGLGDHQVGAAVPVQVAGRQRGRPAVDRVLGPLDRKLPGVRAERQPHRLVLEAPEREIGPAVAVQIGGGERLGVAVAAEGRGHARGGPGGEREPRRRGRAASPAPSATPRASNDATVRVMRPILDPPLAQASLAFQHDRIPAQAAVRRRQRGQRAPDACGGGPAAGAARGRGRDDPRRRRVPDRPRLRRDAADSGRSR